MVLPRKPGLSGIETEAQQLASVVTRTLPVTVASVALWDEPSLALMVKAVDTVRPVGRGLPVGARVPLTEASWRRLAMEDSEPILVEVGENQPPGCGSESELLPIPDVRSMYLVPIRFAGEAVGVLVLGETRAPTREPFSAEKRQRCQAVLNDFVTATTHAWEARRLRRQVRALSSMMRLVHGVAAAGCFEEIMANLAAEVADWVGVPVRGALLGTMGKELRPLARWQLPEDVLFDGGRQMFLAMTRSDAREFGPVTVTVAGDDPLDPLVAIEPSAKGWTRVGIPLMRDERLIGMVCLYLEDELHLAPWEREALRRRGEIVALRIEAIQRVRMLEAEHERSHRLAFELVTGYRCALLQEVFGSVTRALVSSLDRRLRVTLPDLVNRSHASDAVQSDTSSLVQAVVAEVSTAFKELWETNGHSGSPPMSLDVNEIVGHAVRIAKASLEELSRRRGVTLEVRFDPMAQPAVIRGSLVLVGALIHILEGAVEAMPEGGRILVRTGRENGHAVISVEDTGRSGPPASTNGDVERFSVTHPSVTLSLVQSIVHPYGGRVALMPREGSGSALVMYLPTAVDEPVH